MILEYAYLFFGGAFLANGIPHFVKGISGQSFPTPFANPPARGLSSPLTNAVWAMINFMIAYLLLWELGHFDYRYVAEFLVAWAGAFAMTAMLARHFGTLDSTSSRVDASTKSQSPI